MATYRFVSPSKLCDFDYKKNDCHKKEDSYNNEKNRIIESHNLIENFGLIYVFLDSFKRFSQVADGCIGIFFAKNSMDNSSRVHDFRMRAVLLFQRLLT